MSSAYEWLNLIDVSGPFLAEPVLRQTLPDGLDLLDKGVAPRLRSAYDEWREAVDDRDPRLDQIHAAWIDEALTRVLDYDDSTLLRGDSVPDKVSVDLPEHGTSLHPDMVLVEPARPDKPLMLMMVTEADADLDASVRRDGFVASPKERMVALLRGAGCPLGLVTNGEAWTLVHAPEGAVASHATWYARMFGLERETLRAFASLLGIRRFTGPESDRLPSLFKRSLQHQGDVTEALGDQVAQAIEVLMRAFDRADQDRNRELLKDVAPKTLYEAGLTLMMRLVVILSAEERDLLLLGDPIYDAHYAITSMRSQLVAMDPAVLAAREEAWSRLLATFRLVYAGSDHPDLRLPALGGSLFDPDRFPFLEGRKTGSKWQEDPAAPLPIDDRTVLLLLDAIQTFRGRTLSYKALDVEQIGHVYEGLLDQTAGRVEGVTLQLKGSSKARTPLVSFADLEKARGSGLNDLVKLLVERTERSEAAIRNDLNASPEKDDVGRLLTSCRGDAELRDRILPFIRLLADDPWGMPLVHQAGAIVIVEGAERRESASHYTNRSLTEKIVEETLAPTVYHGPAEGTDRKDWQLKSPAKLLDLKICDPTMGSGAFLVQACRWLGDRLVEAWAASEADGRWIDSDGVVYDAAESALDPMVADTEGRTVEARRLIAERCLYGVDMNPLAVELAKLSLWLTTVAKGRPFGFLDHNLRHGDSLLGINDLGQVIELDMTPSRSDQLRLFGRSIGKAVEEAMGLRRELRAHPVRDIEDVKAMARLDAESRRKLELPILIADAFVGCVLVDKKGRALEDGLATIAALADAAAGGKQDARDTLIRMAKRDLAKDEPHERPREPFHWPLEFPEVFGRENGGFDAFVGNPPFIYGKNITRFFGEVYNAYLTGRNSSSTKNVDISAHFLFAAFHLLRKFGCLGFICTSSISEGDTRKAGLQRLRDDGGFIYSAVSRMPWPGAANVIISKVHLYSGEWSGEPRLDGKSVSAISSYLTTEDHIWSPVPLATNKGIATRGVVPNGNGFFLSLSEGRELISYDPKYKDVVLPFLIGEDLNSTIGQTASRYIINFWDWTYAEAQEYPKALDIVRERVKPHRDALGEKKKKIKESWWIYEAAGKDMFTSLGTSGFRHFKRERQEPLERAIAIARVSKTGAFTFVNTRNVFAELTVFASSNAALLAVLQSNVHIVFAWEQAGKMKNDLRYSPSLCFLPFPLPSLDFEALRRIGEDISSHRTKIMREHKFGLTKLYRTFHDQNHHAANFDSLRQLHRDLDRLVAKAYGWDDIEMGHAFHQVAYLPENDRVRYTISEVARREVLHRLAELNRERYKEEVEQGLHGDVKPENKPKPRKAAVKAVDPSIGLDLPEPPQPTLNDKKEALLAFLRSRPGRHGRGNLFGVRRMTNSEFSTAMEELVSEGLVVRDGTAPNETYMISERGKNV